MPGASAASHQDPHFLRHTSVSIYLLNSTTYPFSHLLHAGSVRSFVKAWRGIGASLVIGVLLTGSLASAAQAQDPPPDLTELDLEELMQLDIIPIDVMGSHIHLAGDWMVGYRYMNMTMGEGRSHGGSATDFGGFMVQPTSMRMQMHMVEAMYGVTNDFTLMVMLPYKRLSMDHVTLRGEHFTTASQGIGDLMVGAHYALYRTDNRFLISLFGVHLPTGSINERGETPAGAHQKLPYPMQLGSGTFDLHTGLTFVDQRTHWSWGAHADGRWGLGMNPNAYRLGALYHGGAWLTRRLKEWVALTLHVDMHRRETIHGADPDLNPNMVPTADPDLLGETHIDFLPILDFYAPRGLLKGQRLSIHTRLPLYETHDVPLETDLQVIIGWQITF